MFYFSSYRLPKTSRITMLRIWKIGIPLNLMRILHMMPFGHLRLQLKGK